jgi:hypothetical protein
MLNQRKIADYVVCQRQAHYHVTVKNNQPGLFQDIALYFNDRQASDFVLCDPPIIFLVLYIVQITEHVRPSDFIKITEPWKILRLMDWDNQFFSSKSEPAMAQIGWSLRPLQ